MTRAFGDYFSQGFSWEVWMEKNRLKGAQPNQANRVGSQQGTDKTRPPQKDQSLPKSSLAWDLGLWCQEFTLTSIPLLDRMPLP